MVILNILGQIEKEYISKKLGLYISNLPNGGENNWNNWQEEIRETLHIAYETQKIEYSQYIKKYDNGSDNLFEKRVLERAKKLISEDIADEEVIDKYIEYLSKNMICLELDYRNCSIPEGEESFSCFEGGACEEDPVDKIMELFGFVFGNTYNEFAMLPYSVYSPCSQNCNDYRGLFGSDILYTEKGITELKKIGKLIDDFLQDEQDYYQLDYICNALFNSMVDEKNTYHYMKLYSLCALFLEKDKEAELDFKLPLFMNEVDSLCEREGKAELLRKVRNKIAHGDFEKVSELLEKYAKEYMDGRFVFDYFEHTRFSWVLIHISCLLESILQKIIYLMLVDREKLNNIRNMINPKKVGSQFISYETYMNRLLEIQADCNHEQYLSEVILPILKMCCPGKIKCVPIYDDRATGRKIENETPCKKRMKTICAEKEDGHYVVPDYIFVREEYSFSNPLKPVLMVETKNPIIVEGNKYRKLEDSILSYENELLAEIKACRYLIYTDGITWMFLEEEDGKIILNKKHDTIQLIDLCEKKNKTYKFEKQVVSTKWKNLINTIKELIEELM